MKPEYDAPDLCNLEKFIVQIKIQMVDERGCLSAFPSFIVRKCPIFPSLQNIVSKRSHIIVRENP